MFYQLKITRKGTKPPVWRRCTVAADVTFANMAAMLEKLVQYPAGSLYAVSYTHLDVYKRQYMFCFTFNGDHRNIIGSQFFRGKSMAENNKSFNLISHQLVQIPVSYTHLDVYKRQ